MDIQPTIQPKPGDVVKPNQPVPQSMPQEATAPAPVIAEAPPVIEPMPTPAPTQPIEPEVETTPPVTPPPVEPTQTIAPLPPHHNNLVFGIVLFTVLLLVGAMLYWMYFRKAPSPAPIPVETKETTESTMPTKTPQEDMTTLQYLENQFKSLDNSTTELTNDTEVGNQLNLGTSTTNNSEL